MVSGLVSQEPVLHFEVVMVVMELDGMGSSLSSSRKDASRTWLKASGCSPGQLPLQHLDPVEDSVQVLLHLHQGLCVVQEDLFIFLHCCSGPGIVQIIRNQIQMHIIIHLFNYSFIHLFTHSENMCSEPTKYPALC